MWNQAWARHLAEWWGADYRADKLDRKFSREKNNTSNNQKEIVKTIDINDQTIMNVVFGDKIDIGRKFLGVDVNQDSIRKKKLEGDAKKLYSLQKIRIKTWIYTHTHKSKDSNDNIINLSNRHRNYGDMNKALSKQSDILLDKIILTEILHVMFAKSKEDGDDMQEDKITILSPSDTTKYGWLEAIVEQIEDWETTWYQLFWFDKVKITDEIRQEFELKEDLPIISTPIARWWAKHHKYKQAFLSKFTDLEYMQLINQGDRNTPLPMLGTEIRAESK